MLFYIIDDDDGTRAMIADIIEDEDLGIVIGMSDDGSLLNKQLSILEKANILLIDLLMPVKDGLETVRDIKHIFTGKTIMVSQIESKELIAEAYSSGVSYYITKPINKIEILSVINNVIEIINLENLVQNIHELAGDLLLNNSLSNNNNSSTDNYISHAQFLLSELNIVGENGYQDLLDILDYLFKCDREKKLEDGIPHLKEILLNVAQEYNGLSSNTKELNREIKASEQRIRRVVYHSLTHLASLGLTDFMNPTFENYAPKFFDFTTVQKRMYEIKNEKTLSSSQIRVNSKKYILVLFFETKRLMLDI